MGITQKELVNCTWLRSELTQIRKLEGRKIPTDLAERYHAVVEQNEAELCRITSAVEQALDPTEQRVIKARYLESDGLCCTKWTDVGIILFGKCDEADLKIIYHIHKQALGKLRNYHKEI